MTTYGYTIAWIAWFVFFGATEGRALLNKGKGDTLSEHVWRWFNVADEPRWTFKRFALAAFMVWLSGHFIFGIWAG